jgi:DNA-binding Xre family transcriptional regulator
MISLSVKKQLQLRGIKPSVKNLMSIGIGRRAAESMLYSKPLSIGLQNLMQLCTVLHCTPKELMQVSAEASEVLPTEHPLLTWVQAKAPNPAHYMNYLDPEKLLEVEEFIRGLLDK